MIFFNISKCLILSLLIKYNLYNDKIIKILLKNIYYCGVIPVKMVQWSLPYMKILEVDKNILDVFENTYEKCPLHDEEYTREIYKQDFYINIDEEYEIIDIIGSGSIAQVYKIKDIKSGKLFAMKVKHPNVLNNFNYIKYLLKIIFTFFTFNKIIPVKLNVFIDQFKKQLNFINEGNNLIKFYNLYENNNLYKIPELFKISENIIIMEYIKADTIELLKDNNYKYSKFNLYISLFLENNLNCYNFNHGDLHNYNWKIADEKVVIYDFGLCWEFNDQVSYKTILKSLDYLLEGFYNTDNQLIYQSFKTLIQVNSEISEDIMKEYFFNLPNISRFVYFFKCVVEFSIKYNITLNIELIYIIISYQNILLIFMGNYDDTSEFEHHSLHMEEYNICDYYNIFPEYRQILLRRIGEYNKKETINYNKLNKFIH